MTATLRWYAARGLSVVTFILGALLFMRGIGWAQDAAPPAVDPFGSKLGWLRLAVLLFILVTALVRKLGAQAIPFLATDAGGFILAVLVQAGGTLLLYVTPGTGLELSPQAVFDAVMNAALGALGFAGYKSTTKTVRARKQKPKLTEAR